MAQVTYPTMQTYAPAQTNPSNRWGLVGFFVSLVGLLFTFGALSPLGLLISFIGLFKAPRGLAVAGTILGLIGSSIVAIFGLAIFGGIMVAVGATNEIKEDRTESTIAQARDDIEQYRVAHGTLPDGVEGNKLILKYKDAWNGELQYEGEEVSAGPFIVRSAGSDGKFNTPDDIVVGESPTLTAPIIESGALNGPVDDTAPFQIPDDAPEVP